MQYRGSKQTKIDLQEFCKEQGYLNMRFWIAPNRIVSQEACEHQVLEALIQFEKDKSEGTLIPCKDCL